MSTFGSCVRVAVTGAAGQLAYSLLPLIASGRMLGPAQQVQLNLFDVEPAMDTLEGVRAELIDCAYPLLNAVVATHEPAVAFEKVDIAIFCGSAPFKQGMERKDLLKQNAAMVWEQGSVLAQVASPDCRVCVVTNPANTIALILMKATKGKLKEKNITALTRLDHHRTLAIIAERANTHIDCVKNCVIWGNHSSTQVPDINNATVSGVPVREVLKNDDAFFDGEFITNVRQRVFEILRLRGRTSALSAAHAAVEHVHDWLLGTPPGTFVSMAVKSDGNSYGVPPGLVFSFPVTCSGGEWHIVENLRVSSRVAELIQASARELEEEFAQAGYN